MVYVFCAGDGNTGREIFEMGGAHSRGGQIARNGSEIFAALDFRHCVHGFSIHRHLLRLYLFDQCDVMTSLEFGISLSQSKDRRVTVRVLLAYTVMGQR